MHTSLWFLLPTPPWFIYAAWHPYDLDNKVGVMEEFVLERFTNIFYYYFSLSDSLEGFVPSSNE